MILCWLSDVVHNLIACCCCLYSSRIRCFCTSGSTGCKHCMLQNSLYKTYTDTIPKQIMSIFHSFDNTSKPLQSEHDNKEEEKSRISFIDCRRDDGKQKTNGTKTVCCLPSHTHTPAHTHKQFQSIQPGVTWFEAANFPRKRTKTRAAQRKRERKNNQPYYRIYKLFFMVTIFYIYFFTTLSSIKIV